MSKNIIKVKNLSKDYIVYQAKEGKRKLLKQVFNPTRKIVKAVDHISFSIDRGEAVGYIGVNGAGKSTTIKMLTGILTPTAGSAKVLGLDPNKQREANAANIGVLFGQRSVLWWDVPVKESLWLLKQIYEIPDEDYDKRIFWFSEVLDLQPFMNTPVRQLSLGQRMRANMAAVFLHNPKIVYLDEPTIGLDVIVKQRIRDFLRQMTKEQGTCIFLTTHDLRDVEEICPRIIVLDQGRILYDGNTSGFITDYNKQQSITAQLPPEVNEIILPERMREITCIPLGKNKYQFLFNPNQYSVVEITQLLIDRFSVSDLRIDHPSLETVIQGIYKDQYGKNLKEAAIIENSSPSKVSTK